MLLTRNSNRTSSSQASLELICVSTLLETIIATSISGRTGANLNRSVVEFSKATVPWYIDLKLPNPRPTSTLWDSQITPLSNGKVGFFDVFCKNIVKFLMNEENEETA